MNRPDNLVQEIAALRERLTRLSQANLHITEDLDVDVVLQGVVDGARLITGAERGCMTVIDGAGQIRDFITSGMTDEDEHRLIGLPGALEFFDYLSSLPEPLRVADFSDHAASLGLPEIAPPLGPVGSFLGAPIRLRGERVGNLYLSDKRVNEEFTREDEETLVMFASQAAMAIANARRHQEERQARTDLETLINTSPVGVVVLDAVTGTPKSFNREAGRIVDILRNPDQTTEEFLEILTFRRADGHEISLREFPMTQLLNMGETVRAEEIVMRVPDGRSVTVLLNAAPTLSRDGAVESVVVTLQDMAEIEEMARMRAEFLAMVSHELRAPLASVKGSAATALGSPTDLDPAAVRQFFHIIEEQADHMHGLVSDLLDVARIQTGALSVSPEPAEVAVLLDRARSAFVSAGGRNSLDINIDTDLPLVMADRRRIGQVLGNLLANAARRSPQSSAIRVAAVREGVYVAFSVIDEGRGIPAESLPRLFRKFARIQSEDQRENTGLGLAICKGIVEAHGGRIWAESGGPGLGARFTFTLPTINVAGGGALSEFPPASTRSSQQRRREGAKQVPVLVVDDDPLTLRHVRDTLAQSGYAPIVTENEKEALRLVKEEKPHLVLMDLMLPEKYGIELMREILEITDVPVIFLSAYGQDDFIARAFDMGAVDYVVKPFSPTELTARIGAALRRREVSRPSEPYVLGDLTIDYAERRVTIAGRTVPMVAMEYRLLAELSANAGRLLTYEHLLDRVWGTRKQDDVRPMRTIVSKLRRKLGDNADKPTYIFTEHRVGYRMPKGETPYEEDDNTP